MAKINFVVPKWGATGGCRALAEIANRLNEKHEVNFIYSFLPPGYYLEDYRSWFNPRKVLGMLRRYNSMPADPEFELETGVKRIPWIMPVQTDLMERFVPDADIVIATHWKSAPFVERLSEEKGEKYYFVQHYEIWRILRDQNYWNDVGIAGPEIANYVPDDPELRKYKQTVDDTYRSDLNVIVTSSWEKEVMHELGVEPVGRVDYGVNFEMFYPDRETDETEIVALYRNDEHKGDREALESFKRLHSKHPEVKFSMFGKENPGGLPDFIEFHEDPSQDTIRRLYSRADILIYPSWIEGYGMPPMEAMACRTALVSTKVGAVPDYTHQEGVEFVPIRDADAIVEKTEELLSDPERVEKMKQKNYDHIQQFDWKYATEKFENFIQS